MLDFSFILGCRCLGCIVDGIVFAFTECGSWLVIWERGFGGIGSGALHATAGRHLYLGRYSVIIPNLLYCYLHGHERIQL